jgi:hypothetical protein
LSGAWAGPEVDSVGKNVPRGFGANDKSPSKCRQIRGPKTRGQSPKRQTQRQTSGRNAGAHSLHDGVMEAAAWCLDVLRQVGGGLLSRIIFTPPPPLAAPLFALLLQTPTDMPTTASPPLGQSHRLPGLAGRETARWRPLLCALRILAGGVGGSQWQWQPQLRQCRVQQRRHSGCRERHCLGHVRGPVDHGDHRANEGPPAERRRK